MLHEAAKSGDIDSFVNLIVNQEGNINQPFHHFVKKNKNNDDNNSSVVVDDSKPVEKNNSTIQEGDTPLLVAATYGQLQIVLYLLNQPGINISYQNPHPDDENALHRAAANNPPSVVQELPKPSIADLPFFDAFVTAAKSSSY